MSIRVELWKKDGSTSWHQFESQQEVDCVEWYRVKDGVPCPFTKQAQPVEDIREQDNSAEPKEKRPRKRKGAVDATGN